MLKMNPTRTKVIIGAIIGEFAALAIPIVIFWILVHSAKEDGNQDFKVYATFVTSFLAFICLNISFAVVVFVDFINTRNREGHKNGYTHERNHAVVKIRPPQE